MPFLHRWLVASCPWFDPVCPRSGRRSKQKVPRVPFDASGILKQFGGADFGQVRVAGLHLSARQATDQKTGYYQAEAVIGLP